MPWASILYTLLLVATPLSALRLPRRVIALQAGALALWPQRTPGSMPQATGTDAKAAVKSAVPYIMAADTSFIVEADAKWALARHQRIDVETSFATIPTSFCREASSKSKRKLLFLHGADANFFEWRYMLRRLSDTYDCTALD